MAVQHDQIVMQMNRVRQVASARIQCALPSVGSMIDEPGGCAGDRQIPFEQEMSMLKTISAALLAVSVFVAPVLAAESVKTSTNAPVTKTSQVRSSQGKTVQPTAPEARSAVLNANARMGKHHRKHFSSHHRHHGKMAAMKTIQPKVHAKGVLKTAPKVSLKPVTSTTRRG